MTISDELCKPVTNINYRTPQEVFDIMSDRVRSALAAKPGMVSDEAGVKPLVEQIFVAATVLPVGRHAEEEALEVIQGLALQALAALTPTKSEKEEGGMSPDKINDEMRGRAHTPGPWVRSGAAVMSETPLRMIATIGAPSSRDDEDAANSRLIAAAPELLAALRSAIVIIGHPDDIVTQALVAVADKATSPCRKCKPMHI